VINAVKSGAQTTSLPDGYANRFIDKIVEIGLTNTREILYSYEKYISGVPLEEAIVPPPDQNPMYTDIAKFAVKGDWLKTRILLQKTKVSDAKGLKSVVSGFFRSNLTNGYGNDDACAEALIRLGNLASYEDGVLFGGLVGIIYTYSKKVKK
jgi:hypothetical protein